MDTDNLPYEKTKWGLFYASYRDKTQSQLQKHLIKMGRLVYLINQRCPYQELILRQFFIHTDEKNGMGGCGVPRIVFRSMHEYYFRDDIEDIWSWFKPRVNAEYQEMKAYYEAKKVESVNVVRSALLN